MRRLPRRGASPQAPERDAPEGLRRPIRHTRRLPPRAIMNRFLHAHATHPNWRMGLGLVAAQIEAQRGTPGFVTETTLGWLYLTDHLAGDAEALFAAVRDRWPGMHWVGAVGVGIAGNGVEYIDEPAIAVMMSNLSREDFRVFSGAQPLTQGSDRLLRFDASTALVHADPNTPDLPDLIAEMSDRTATGYLFGGLASSRGATVQIADGVFRGGLSGVAFSHRVALLSRVTQGCQPVGPMRRITASDRNVITALDGSPALDCLLQDLDAAESDPRAALAKLQRVLVGLSAAGEDLLARPGQFGADTVVRHLVGFDPQRRGVAVADQVGEGMRAAFCTRDTEAARRDLVRICSEIREELEPESPPRGAQVAGALYVSCSGRGGPHFGGPSAELRIVQQALCDVPLVGFFAAGEIARHHLFGYTGVLTVFMSRMP
jgi:small ligand-binding sensory domain FIST